MVSQTPHLSIGAMKIPCLLLFLLNLLRFSASAPSPLTFSNNEANPVGNHIASYFHKCHTHVVDLAAKVPFNYGTSEVPRTLYVYPGSYLGNDSIYYEISGTEDRRAMRIRTIHQKIKTFNCMLTMISVFQGIIDFKRGATTLPRVLNQGNVLSYGESSTLKQIMPHYVVVFTVPDNVSSPEEKRINSEAFMRGVIRTVFGRKFTANLPALFALQTSSKPLKGFLYCWYCAKEHEQTAFSCSSSAHCPVMMMETYLGVLAKSRRDIPWTYVKKDKVVMPSTMRRFCPLTLGQKSSCLGEEIDIVVSFLTEGSNRSVVAAIVQKGIFKDGLPCITYKRVAPNEHAVDIVLVGRSVQFRFITSDGVQSDQPSFATFAAPFSGSLWLSLGVTLILLAVFRAAMSSLRFRDALPRSIIGFASLLIDHVTSDVLRSLRFPRTLGVMMNCWIFAAIVVTTCYKSIMKSNYMTEQKYTTRWKSFKEIENFTFIYAESIYEEFWREFTKREFRVWKGKLNVCKKDRNSYDRTCVLSHEPLFWKSQCLLFQESTDDRFACEIFNLALLGEYMHSAQIFAGNQIFHKWFGQKTLLLQRMTNQSRIRPFSRIRKVIREELLQPRTAFVSAAETFEADWKIFKKVSRRLNVRFAHSQEGENFGSIFGYELTGGFNEYVRNAMHVRGEMLMESGIFWLWKKWERLRRAFRVRNRTVEGKEFVELSFGNSDVHLVFYIYLISVTVAVLVGGAECLLKWSSS